MIASTPIVIADGESSYIGSINFRGPASTQKLERKNTKFERFVAAKRNHRANTIVDNPEERVLANRRPSMSDSRSLVSQCSSIQRFVAVNQNRTKTKTKNCSEVGAPVSARSRSPDELGIHTLELQQEFPPSEGPTAECKPHELSSPERKNDADAQLNESPTFVQRLPLNEFLLRTPLCTSDGKPPALGNQTTKKRVFKIRVESNNNQNGIIQRNTSIEIKETVVTSSVARSVSSAVSAGHDQQQQWIAKSLLKVPRYKATVKEMRRQLNESKETTFMSEDMSIRSDDDEYTDDGNDSGNPSELGLFNFIRVEANNNPKGAIQRTRGGIDQTRNVTWWDDEKNRHTPYTMKTDKSISWDDDSTWNHVEKSTCNTNFDFDFFKRRRKQFQFIGEEEKKSVEAPEPEDLSSINKEKDSDGKDSLYHHSSFDVLRRRTIGDLLSNYSRKQWNGKDFSRDSSIWGTPIIEDDGSASLLKRDLLDIISSPFTSSSLFQGEDNSLGI